ncbi:hypothetical protein Q3G72_010695 [Acer saccharum]|nr:hypothetical protein Q3G72_010695 [Acer saccharum]
MGNSDIRLGSLAVNTDISHFVGINNSEDQLNYCGPALMEIGLVILESSITKSADGVNVNGPAILDPGPVHYEPTTTILTDGLTDNGLDPLSRQVENRITGKVIAKFRRFGDLRKVEKQVEKHPAICGGKRNIEKVGKVHSSLHKKLRNEEKDKLVPVECELGSSSSAKETGSKKIGAIIEKNSDARHKNSDRLIVSLVGQALVSCPGSVLDLFIGSFHVGHGTKHLLNHLLIVALDSKAFHYCKSMHPHCFCLTSKKPASSSSQDADVMWFRNPVSQIHPLEALTIACDFNSGDLPSVSD